MNDGALSILYAGPLLPGSTTLQRLLALRRLGHTVEAIHTTGLVENRSLKDRLLLHLGHPRDRHCANDAILEAARREVRDIVWCDKAITLSQRTLESLRADLPNAVLVSYSPDDMTVRPNASHRFRRALPIFDVHFTTKPHNVPILTRWGARRVDLVENGYAPETHRPMPRTPAERAAVGAAVGFIGDYESDRARSLLHLARQGLPVRVWGPNWTRRIGEGAPSLRVEPEGLYGTDYARALSNTDVNLAFLRRSVGDRVTTRSVEIPACGGFMLAERTEEHQRLFEEGKEAEFFGSDEELLQKCRYYLAHAEQRERIAAAGRQRCLEGGYGNDARLERMIDIVQEIARFRAGPCHSPDGRSPGTRPVCS